MTQNDALGLFQAMRPPPPSVPASDVRAAAQNSLRGLAMTPGTPGYNSRIPPPPCTICGEDHLPGHSYDHTYMSEMPIVHDEPVSASAVLRRPDSPPPSVEVTAVVAPTQRVAVYVGRGETYVVAIERAPDWDAETTFKVPDVDVIALVQMARALGVKVVDKTGGDLVMLEQEYGNGRRKLPQADGRSAEGAGSDQP